MSLVLFKFFKNKFINVLFRMLLFKSFSIITIKKLTSKLVVNLEKSCDNFQLYCILKLNMIVIRHKFHSIKNHD